MELEACLPAALRASATLTKIAAGMSGAGVYRASAGGAEYVLTIAEPTEPLVGWRQRREVQQSAAAAGLAPMVVHVDEDRRAVLSELVVDRGVFPRLMNPATREATIAQLGSTIARVHALPIPPGLAPHEPLATLAALWTGIGDGFAPAFVGGLVERMLAEVPAPSERAPVLGHNDVNPSNLVFDGTNLVLLDWDTAAPADPFYDLATLAVFLRLDDGACQRLIAAHDDVAVAALPTRFAYSRRLVATLCATAFLQLARAAGHPGGPASVDASLSLAEVHQQMRAGTLDPRTAAGQWTFGLALAKASALLERE